VTKIARTDIDVAGGVVMKTVMEELGQLIRSMPGPNASAATIAHWYELKAQMLEQVAEEHQADRHTTLRQATAAHRRARALLANAA
jgi:hypothetical protein